MTLPNGQHGVLCYFTDVTERLRAEAALEDAKAAAEAANSSKDRFLAVLSHELAWMTMCAKLARQVSRNISSSPWTSRNSSR